METYENIVLFCEPYFRLMLVENMEEIDRGQKSWSYIARRLARSSVASADIETLWC